MGNPSRRFTEQLGDRVRRLRRERGFSQDRVSLSANIDQSGYSKFERGLRNFGDEALHRIADALGVEFDEMVRGIESDRTRT